MEDAIPRQNSLPPHLQHSQSYMRGHTATPPPMTNGIQYHQRQQTPQPQIISRPGSSHAIRRSSTNLGPSHLQQVTQGPQANGNYTYMRTPPMQNYQANGPVHNGQPTGTQQYFNQLQQQQAYLHEPRRQSVPPTFPQQEPQRQPGAQPTAPSPPQPERRTTQDDQNNRLQQPKATKSRSIFTPIDDSRSLLAQQWGGGKPTSDAQADARRDAVPQLQAAAAGEISHGMPGSPPPNIKQEAPKRTMSNDFVPPVRTDSAAGGKRPKLKVHIPEEQSDGESADGSAKNHSSGKAETPAKGSNENSHSSGPGVVLPPPSPSASASALLSAGATGPPNPFARPLPPPNPQQHNNAAFERNRNENIETPISALPSRFVSDALLPSPSSFYPDWNFRSGGDSAVLPSPLNFQTPVNGTGPNFGREEEGGEKKRKTPEGDLQDNAMAKRLKA